MFNYIFLSLILLPTTTFAGDANDNPNRSRLTTVAKPTISSEDAKEDSKQVGQNNIKFRDVDFSAGAGDGKKNKNKNKGGGSK